MKRTNNTQQTTHNASPTEVGALRHPEVALAAERTHGTGRGARHGARHVGDRGTRERFVARAGLVLHHEVHEARLTEGQRPAGGDQEQGETGGPHGASEPVGSKGSEVSVVGELQAGMQRSY